MPINIPILDGEDWLASQAIDDTDSVIRSLLELTNACIKLKIKIKEQFSPKFDQVSRDEIILRDTNGATIRPSCLVSS